MTFQDLALGLPVIASLVLIEGLLSVDNVLGIAALAKSLPPDEQKKAIRLGMMGAYVFRLLALLVAAWLIENTGVRLLAAGYLIFLMADHLTARGNGTEGDHAVKLKPSFGAALAQIALMDLSLSIDNVIAAVGLAPHGADGHILMWPIYVGVLLAILALLTIAPYAVRLLEKYPILEPTAFILIGFVGFLLLGEELATQLAGSGAHPAHLSSPAKFVCILIILGLALLYSKSQTARNFFRPVFRAAQPILKAVAGVGALIRSVLTRLISLLRPT